MDDNAETIEQYIERGGKIQLLPKVFVVEIRYISVRGESLIYNKYNLLKLLLYLFQIFLIQDSLPVPPMPG